MQKTKNNNKFLTKLNSTVFNFDTNIYTNENNNIIDIKIANNKVVSQKIAEIDNLFKPIIHNFYSSTIKTFFDESKIYWGDFINKLLKIFDEIENKIVDLEYPINQKFIKIQFSNFLELTNNFLVDFANQSNQENQTTTIKNVTEYIDKITEIAINFPNKLSLTIEESDFNFDNDDSVSTKLKKTNQKIVSKVSKQKNTEVDFKSIANFYLLVDYDNEVKNIFINFLIITEKILLELKNIISETNQKFEKLAELKEFDIEIIKNYKQEIIEFNNKFLAVFDTQSIIFKNRFINNFNDKLNLLSDDLEIGHKKILDKDLNILSFFEIEDFLDKWYKNLYELTNTILCETILFSYKFKFKYKIDNLLVELCNDLNMNTNIKLFEISNQIDLIKNKTNSISEFEFLNYSVSETSKDLFLEINKLINESILSLPQTFEVVEITEFKLSDLIKSKSIYIDFRKLIDECIEIDYINKFQVFMNRITNEIQNYISLVNKALNLYNFENSEENLIILSEVVIKAQTNLEQYISEIINISNHNLDLAFQNLNISKLISSQENLDSFSPQTSKSNLKKITAKFKNIFIYFKNIYLKHLYKRSEKEVKEYNDASQNQIYNIEDFISISNKISANKNIIKKLPLFYKNLFNTDLSTSDDLLLNRNYAINQAKNAIERFVNKLGNAIIITGEPNSGKTELSKQIANNFFMSENIYFIEAKKGGSIIYEDFVENFQKIVHQNQNMETIFNSFSQNCVVIIDDLELWWQRSDNGFNVINQILKLIKSYESKCFFIINCNIFSYNFINRIQNIDNIFISHIICEPFTAFELLQTIKQRHKASGYSLKYNNKIDSKITPVKLAKLFNLYFDITEGNVGFALNMWLNCIYDFDKNIVSISKPKTNNIDFYYNCTNDTITYLVLFALHKELTINKLVEIMNFNQKQKFEKLAELQNSTLLAKSNKNIYEPDKKELKYDENKILETINFLYKSSIITKNNKNIYELDTNFRPIVFNILNSKNLI